MKHKYLIIMLAAILAMAAGNANAYDAEVDGIYYYINYNSKSASVACKSLLDLNNRDAYEGEISIPNTILYNGEIYSVTSISGYTFWNCANLTSITIPNSVTTIGFEAFYGCSGLTSVTIPNSVTTIGERAFYGCSGMATVTIPNSVTSIGNSAFYGCSGLTSVSIPNSVTTIGFEAFSGCSSLVKAEFASIKSLCEIFFTSYRSNPISYAHHLYINGQEVTSVTIPDGVTSIGACAFSGCSGLTSVTIPNSVTSIGERAFYGCSGMTSVTIPNSVTSIGNSVFYGCSGLTSITIPNSVTGIGYEAFSGCSGLTSVIIPNSVTSIGERAFYGCSGMTSVTIPNSATSIGNSVFYGCSGLTSITIPNSVTGIGYEAFSGCSGLTSVTIPNSVTSIGERAFYGCSGMTSVTIPNSVTSIGNSVFYGCSGLTSVTIPESVTKIGAGAFYGCTNLNSVIIPNSVTCIGRSAFAGCSGLTSVTIPNSVTSIGSWAFDRTAWYDNQPDGVVYAGKFVYGYKGIMPENTSIEIKDGTLGIAGHAFSYSINQFSVTIPESVVTIGDEAFQCCGLTSITIPNSVTTIGYRAFHFCENLASIVLPNNMPSLGVGAFSGCRGLVSIDIPDGWTAITDSLFAGCRGLTSVNIPNSVTSIGWTAFEECSNLTTITIPSSVTSIKDAAFNRCNALTSVKVEMETPIAITEDVFTNRANATLLVPRGCKAAYEAADYWKEFKEIVEANYVDVDDQTIVEGQSATIAINVSNNPYTDLVGFQMDLTLPDGVGIDKTGCSLSSRITDEAQEMAIGKLENGTYRLVSSSYSLKPISGTSGTLLTLKLTATEGCMDGQATLSNIFFSTSNSERVTFSDETFDIRILHKYTLTYKVDGEVYKTEEIVETTPLTPEPEPTKEGYTFNGWSEIPETMPASDVVVTGTYTVNTYAVIYKVDGEEYKTDSVTYNAAITPETEPTKEGYTFSGWSEIPTTMPASDVVVTGSFTINTYTITYKVDGEVYKTDSVTYNASITPEAEPSKEGHTFSGWSEIPPTMPANDITITGTFTVNTYQVTFMYGDEVLKTDSVEYGAVIPLPESLESDRYTLVEWLDVPETMPAHDLVIYADYTDGIGSIENGRLKIENATVYDLSGRRITRRQKGINILNGRKVVIR